MGKISKGILGGFSGKVGNVVGATWKGIDYMRIMPASVANPRTPDQLDQRSRFMTALRFLQPLTEFLRIGYRLYAIKMSQFNNAMSFIVKNAITGVYPDYEVDFSSALVSRGNLAGPVNASAVSTDPNTVDVSWDDNSGFGSALATDKALIVVYNGQKSDVVYSTDDFFRADGAASVNVPSEYSGDTVQVYLGFASADGTKVANSVFLGSMLVA